LAERCKKHLNKLVSKDQNGFVPGRYIGLNINRILNLIEICKENKINGILLNIDFEKAFDCIEWDFIYSALEAFGFPHIFIKWVKVLYNNISSCVINNGKFTTFFDLQRGVRQGCPLSPYLFVLGAEILSLYIKQLSGIQGIVHEGYNYLISQFADDTSLAVLGHSANIKLCFKVLNDFEKVSGLKVNVAKTEALGLGTFKTPTCLDLKIQWVEKSTKVLGIYVSKDPVNLIDQNYNDILERIRAKLNGWKRRNLSILGKINIIKCLGISQVVYLLTMLPSPGTKFLKELEGILFNFIWNNSNDRIKRSTLIGNLDLGGINMIDVGCLNKALKIGWIKRLLQQGGTWSSLIISKLPFTYTADNINYYLQANLHLNEFNIWLKLDKESMWYEIMFEWYQYTYKTCNQLDSKDCIVNQNIWFNSTIRIANKPVYYKSWYTAGIKYINNLLDGNKWKSPLELEQEFDIKINLLDYLGILNSIPVTWRRILKLDHYNGNNMNGDTYTSNIDKLLSCKQVNKSVYMELVSKKCCIPTKRWENWLEELGEDISELDWLDIFPRINKCTTSTRLRSLGYRFLIRDVLTNTRLTRMGKALNEFCYLCKTEVESISHLYWHCAVTKRLWERLKLFLLEKANINLTLDPLELLLGASRENPDESPPELILLLSIVVKNFIHSCKCRNTRPTEEGLLCRIKSTQKIEYTIAKKNGAAALRNHQRKWYWMA